MVWVYHQNSRVLSHNHIQITKGYSGKGRDKNRHDRQHIKNRGPIPVGQYTLEDGPFTHYKTGRYTIRLKPNPANEMFGRDSFMIHGDSKDHPGQASEGCIILQRQFREKIWNSGDHDIEVVE